MSLKNNVESLLFSSGRRMSTAEIARLCKADTEDVKRVLNELKEDYRQRESSLMTTEEGDYWKITVKEPYLPLVRKIVTKTELDKGTLETLAVIAFKYPVLQSDVIRIRTNKAYDHMKNLEEYGYISRQKHGRTRLIKLTQKFFEYFDLPEDKIKDAFKDFESLAKAIDKKEQEIEKAEQQKKEEQKQPEVDLVDEKGHKKKLDAYEAKEEPEKEEEAVVKLGLLEVIDEAPEPEKEEVPESSIDSAEEPEAEQDVEKKVKEILTEKEAPPEKEVDERVEEIMHPPEDDADKETDNQPDKPEEEPQDIFEADRPKKKRSANKEQTDEEPPDLLDASSGENNEEG